MVSGASGPGGAGIHVALGSRRAPEERLLTFLDTTVHVPLLTDSRGPEAVEIFRHS